MSGRWARRLLVGIYRGRYSFHKEQLIRVLTSVIGFRVYLFLISKKLTKAICFGNPRWSMRNYFENSFIFLDTTCVRGAML